MHFSTLHSTIAFCQGELLFRLKLRTTQPDFDESHLEDLQTVCDRDSENKQSGKQYANPSRDASYNYVYPRWHSVCNTMSCR